MSDDRRAPALVAALSARGWDLVNHVQATGMMANSRASLALVRRRHDARPGFAKCIWQAVPTDGADTQWLADPVRLARVRDRLETIRGRPSLPMVPLLDLSLMDAPACLLIIMEPVAPIARRLPGPPDDALAARVLRALDPAPHRSIGWTHFDICPANSATTAAGEPVLIDPESAYVVHGGTNALDVSCLAAKWHRSPRGWWQEAIARGRAGQPIDDLGLHKHAYEVLFLAAEVSIGQPAPFPGGDARAEDWILLWFAALERHEPHAARAAFWRTHLVGALDRGKLPNLGQIADELACRFAAPASTPAAEPLEMLDVGVKGGDPRGEAMREDRLTVEELGAYLDDLIARGRAGAIAEPWLEACVLCVCYLRDRRQAFKMVGLAMAKHPENRQLAQWGQMIRMWASVETD